MKKLLNMIGAITLLGTASANLVNNNLISTNLQSVNKVLNKTKFTEKNKTLQRYDSLNLIDTQNLNSTLNSTIKNINDKCKKDINYIVNGKNYNYKDELLKIFSNKDNFLKTNNQYEKYLNQSNSYQKNKLGISFPMNYNGLYFSWWGFGDYFYWYMSSNTVKKIQQYLAYGQASFVLAVNSILLASGVGRSIDYISWCMFASIYC